MSLRLKTVNLPWQSCLIFCLGLLTVSNTFGQDLFEEDESHDKYWLLGLGLSVEDSAYSGVKTEASPFPYIAYETKRWHFGVDGINFAALAENNWDASLILKPRFGLSSPNDEDQLDTIDRDTVIEGGLSATLDFTPFYLSATVLTDLSHRQADGYFGKISFGIETELGPGELDLSVDATYRNTSFNDYLYGVREDEITTLMPFYKPDADISSSINTSYIIPLSENSLVFLGFSIDFLSDAAKASPRVVTSTEKTVQLGLLWRF